MSIMDKFKNAVDTSTHQKDVADLQRDLALRETEANALHAEIAENTGKLEDAALDAEASGSRKSYDTIKRKIGETQTELEIKLVAVAATRKKLTAAQDALHVAKFADRERKVTEYNRRRDKHTAKAAEHLAALYKEHTNVIELGREIANEFPELTMNHVGTMVAAGEWLRALEVEIARVTSPGILPPTMAIPALPGGRVYALGGNPTNAVPLIEVMTKAGAELLRRIVAKPLPGPPVEKSKASPAPVAADPDAAILEAAGPTLSAEQVQAGLGRRRLA